MRTKPLFLLLILLVLGRAIPAQEKQISNEPMIWLEATNSFKLNSKVSGLMLYQHRVFLKRSFTYQNVYWLSVSYAISPKINMGGGFMYFRYHRIVDESYLSVPEARPFQFITYNEYFDEVSFSNRLMIEERLQERVENAHLTGDYDLSFRMRNRIRIAIPVSLKTKMVVSEELLFNVANDFFDQNRASLRYYYQLGKLALDVGYLHWLVDASTSLQHRNALLLGAHYKF